MTIRKAPFVLIILLSLVGTSSSDQEKDQIYESPDGNYIAHIISLPKAQYGSGESEIVIKSNKGMLLYSKNYGSETGEHGFGVERAAWTANSQFFVYSMSSSGGHQSWHFPTSFFSIKDNNVLKLDEYFGPITDPEFELFSPDTIKTTGRNKNSLDEERFEVKLGDLIKQK
jgi:hypothetical protein